MWTLPVRSRWFAGGEIEFTQKLYNGDSAGAIATVVYNNQPGLFYMDLTYYWGSTPLRLYHQ